MCERPAQFLFDRQEETRCQREHRKPQRRNGSEGIIAAESVGADTEERVGRDTGNDQADRDRYRPLRHCLTTVGGHLGGVRGQRDIGHGL